VAHWNLGGVATAVTVAPPVGVPGTVRFYNEGSNPVYLGGSSVTPSTGFKLLPGCKIELPSVNSAYYGCSGASPTTTSTTVTTSATAGTSVFTVGSTTGFVAGTTLLIGNSGTTSLEQIAVLSTASSTVFTAATNSNFDHMAGATVATATVAIGQLRCEPGVL
jgi:hypothetical protein